MPLSVCNYDKKEADSLLDLSNDHIRAFSPVTFIQAGYPIRVSDERELLRYVDTMQELNNPRGHYDEAVYSQDEVRLVTDVCGAVVNLTEARFGRRICPWMGPFGAMTLFRAISAISDAVGSKLRILELGPGSGYLGAMLAKSGHSYTSMDITQGFYLWQNRLLEAVVPGEFYEGVEADGWPYPAARNVHIPWWDYARLSRFDPPQFDVIACDHALGEMHAYALRYVTQLSRLMLEDARPGLFMYSSIGAPHVSSEEVVRLNFERVGLDRIITGLVSAFTVRGRDFPERLKVLASDIPFYSPSGATARLRGREFMKLSWDEAPPSYEMYQFMGYDTPIAPAAPVEAPPGRPMDRNPADPIGPIGRIARRVRHFLS